MLQIREPESESKLLGFLGMEAALLANLIGRDGAQDIEWIVLCLGSIPTSTQGLFLPVCLG